MSIRSLLSTTVTSTEQAITGLVSLGSSVGNGFEWIKRNSARINSAEAIKAEEREYRVSLAERNQATIKRAEKLDPDYDAKLEALDKLLGL